MKTRLVQWTDDYLGDPTLLRMNDDQLEVAKGLFLAGQEAEDMSELEKYLNTMPKVDEVAWICSDMFDGAHLYDISDIND